MDGLLSTGVLRLVLIYRYIYIYIVFVVLIINEKLVLTKTLKIQMLLLKNTQLNDLHHLEKKSRIRETKHLSTNADSSTDAIGG